MATPQSAYVNARDAAAKRLGVRPDPVLGNTTERQVLREIRAVLRIARVLGNQFALQPATFALLALRSLPLGAESTSSCYCTPLGTLAEGFKHQQARG